MRKLAITFYRKVTNMHKEFFDQIDGHYKGYSPGNTKIFYSENRIIYKVYPFDIILDRPKIERKEKVKETSCQQRRINLQNKKIELLGLGMCNKWQYFFTGTLDPKKFSTDFDTVSKMISREFKKMRQRNKSVEYCFILEKFKKGDYHAHGFINIPDEFINHYPGAYVRDDGSIIKPSKSKFIQWTIKQCYYSLGLNVISPIQSINDVADYCRKYIIKDPARGKKDSKSIFKSHGLKSFDVQYGNYIGDVDVRSDGFCELMAGDQSLESVQHYKKFYDGEIFTIDIKLL